MKRSAALLMQVAHARRLRTVGEHVSEMAVGPGAASNRTMDGGLPLDDVVRFDAGG